jgi:hypothetical protein
MDNQHAKAAKYRLRDSKITGYVFDPRFTAEHFEKTMQRAAATSDSPALCIGHHQHIANVTQRANSPASLHLQFVRGRLPFVCGGDDEIVPRSRSAALHARKENIRFS